MEKPELNQNPVFIDNRGTFAPLQLKYNDKNQSHLIKDWIQSNVSVNPHKHTLRGLHYQIEPYAQAKLIKVISGAIIDFIVDIRPRSEDYGSVHIFDLKQSDELLVPAGFAHGFITIEDNTVVQYLVDNRYSPASERSMLWSSVDEVVKYLNDNINEFNTESVLISPKDKECQTYQEKIAEYKFAK